MCFILLNTRLGCVECGKEMSGKHLGPVKANTGVGFAIRPVNFHGFCVDVFRNKRQNTLAVRVVCQRQVLMVLHVMLRLDSNAAAGIAMTLLLLVPSLC